MFSLGNFLGVEKENRTLLYRIYFIFFASGMMSTLLGAILPKLSESYSLDYAFSGVLLSAHQIGNLFAVIAAGYIPYLIGRRRSTVILGSFIVIGLLLMTVTGNPVLLFIAFACTGIGRGTMSNITNVVVGENCGNKAAGLNLLHASFAIGAFISPFVAILVIPSSWRYAPILVSSIMFIALILVFLSKLSSERGTRKKGEDGIPRSLGFWLNTAVMFMYLCAEASLTGWLVTSCAIISPHMKNKNVLILILGLMMTFFFILMVSSANPIVSAVAVLGTGLAMSGIYPTTLSTMESRYNSSTSATGICIGTATIGAIVMPSIVGMVAEKAGIRGGIMTISAALVIMVLLMITKLLLSIRRS